MFDWPRTLQATARPDRAIVQIANAPLVRVLAGVSLLCFTLPDLPATTPLGRAVLAGVAALWWLRLALHFVWLRLAHPLVHTLSALLATAGLLFSVAALRGLPTV